MPEVIHDTKTRITINNIHKQRGTKQKKKTTNDILETLSKY